MPGNNVSDEQLDEPRKAKMGVVDASEREPSMVPRISGQVAY